MRKKLLKSENEQFDPENSLLNQYIKDITTPLLTKEEAVELSKRKKKGDKLAEEHMIKANLRLVINIAGKYQHYGLDIIDLISEGNIGLMKGVEKYDHLHGAKIATYARHWISQAIKLALANQSHTIRRPVHIVDKIFQMKKVLKKLGAELGREPLDVELAKEMGVGVSKIEELRSYTNIPTSLHAPINGDESDADFGNFIPDTTVSTASEIAEDNARYEMLNEMLEGLDPREATVLRYRFGFDGGKDRTLEEVGRKFKITRERVRQIQLIAFKKLRKRIEKKERIYELA